MKQSEEYRRVLSLSQQLLIYMLAKNSTINNNNFYFQYNETNTCRMEIIIQMQYSTVQYTLIKLNREMYTKRAKKE